MRKKLKNKSGYIGILAILIGTALMLFLFIKVYFTPSKTTTEFQPTNTQGIAPTTQYERLRTNVDTASNIANEQKRKAEEANRLINSI